MKAVIIADAGPSGRLELRDVPDPELMPGSICIDVRAAGVNHADIAQREGRYAQHATHGPGNRRIAGLEISGVVAKVGANVTGWREGDEVMAMCAGGYAERVVVDARLAMRKPTGLSWAEAAAVPVAFVTAHDALVTAGRAGATDAVLVTGASSAVGSAVGQIARLIQVERLVGITGSAEKCRKLLADGFDMAFDHTEHPIASLPETAGPVDVVIDMVGGDWLPPLLDTMGIGARLVSVGRLRGGRVDFDLDVVARKRLSLLGVSFRSRTIDEYAQTVGRAGKFIADPMSDGRLRPAPVTVYDLGEARRAQDELATRPTPSKSVLRISD